MAFTSIHFLPPLEPKIVQLRETELRQAEARSHAAIISYPKSRKRRALVHTHRVSQPEEPEKDGMAVGKTERKLLRGRNLQSHSPKLLLPVETGGLDPFLKVADDLSRSDRTLLHSCELS